MVAQTVFNAINMMELSAGGRWEGTGVQNPEYFSTESFMTLMGICDFPAGIVEMDSEYRRARDATAFRAVFSVE